MPDGEVGLAHDFFYNAPCGFVIVDDAGSVVAANDTLSDWLGMSPAALERRPATAIFGRASGVVFETSLLPLLRLQPDVAGVSLDLVARDGTKIPVVMSADSRGEGSQRLTRLVLLKASARRVFERELTEARSEAEARLSLARRQGELREQFVAVLGHDLRNPLAALSSAIRMISREPEDGRKEEILRLMQGSVQRMSRLIDNVLDFARNRLGGGIELDLCEGDLEETIRQTVEELRSVNPGRDMKVDISIRHGVRCDTGRIGQLVSNLLGNALIHGDPRHPVTLDASTSASGALEINVCNRGEPIPAASFERLFDPFERRGGDRGGGLGLGLYIASEISKAHGGVLEARSEDVTCFTFRMPASAVKA